MTVKNRSDDILGAAITAAGDTAYAWNLDDDSMVWHGAKNILFDNKTTPKSGDAFAQRIHPADNAGRLKMLSAHLNEAKSYEVEYRIRNSKGDLVWVHDRGSVDAASQNGQTRLCGVIRIIEARKKRETQLEYLTNFDELTGHFNRVRFCENLGRAILIARRYENHGVYMVIAPDNPSKASKPDDQKSRKAALVTLGQQLDRSLRASDIIGRVGEDRFGVVLPRCSETEAILIAEKIINTIGSPADNGEQASVSIGLVSFPDLAETVSDTMQKAEVSLHEALQKGGNSWVSYAFSAQQHTERKRAIALAEKTRNALAEDRMILVFQPVLRAQDGVVECYECLLRIREKDHHLTPASSFIPTIEKLGLIRLIDHYVLEEVIEHLKTDPNLILAMNISGMTVSDHAWLRTAITHLKDQPDITSRMIIEITETSAIQDLEECARFVEMMRGIGCRVALDDFGIGHTSFRHVQSIPIDMIKIAGTYIRDLSENRQNRAFVETMIELAHKFGLQVVAEWVETQHDADLLIDMGIDFLQGNHCGAAHPEPHPPAIGG